MEATNTEYIFKSDFPAVPVPEGLILPEFVLQNSEKYADKVAIVDSHTSNSYTYADVQWLSQNAAKNLAIRHGVGKGDVVLVLLPNMAEYPIFVFGIMSAGGVFSGANPAMHPSEISKQASDSASKVIITTPSLAEKLTDIAAKTIIVSEHSNPLFEENDGVFHAEVSQDDLCALPYSSGTTGSSKGVMLTHRNLISNLCSTLFSVDESLIGKFTTLGLMPFFHIYGTTGICCSTLRQKGKVVVMSRFDLRHFVSTLIDYEVNFAPIVPPIMLALVKNPVVQEFDLSRLQLKAVMTAAAPLAPELLRSFEEKFPGVQVQEAYGLTEHSCITLTHCAPGEVRGNAKRSSVGFILPNLEVKFVDPETGKSLPRNTLGEICVRSQCVMKGYYKRKEETDKTVDEEGWLHTGDVGYIDDDGDIFVVDRIKELIKYKGFQVAPAELEALLLSHPSVDDAAVVPLPDEAAGEIPAACVVMAGSAKESKEDMMKFVAERVAPYKKIRRMEFVSEIPKSSSGKILRRVLRDKLIAMSSIA